MTMSEQTITTTPNYQQLIGKKVLELKHVHEYNAGGADLIGNLVLIVEAVDVMHAGDMELREVQWRIIGAGDYTLRDFFYRGSYKVVGVGLVFNVDGYRYQVLVNDTFREEFTDDIPF